MITNKISESGFGVKDRSKEEIQAAILQAEIFFASQPIENHIQIEAKHYFVNGLYIREIFLPKDSFNTGKYHIQEDILIIARGKVTFFTEHGQRTLEGPCVTKVHANTKPCVFAHEDTVMISAHANPDNTQDIDLIESRIIVPNELADRSSEVIR